MENKRVVERLFGGCCNSLGKRRLFKIVVLEGKKRGGIGKRGYYLVIFFFLAKIGL